MNSVSINSLLGIYSAIMTFFTFISIFFTFPAIHRINDIEPRVRVVEHVTIEHSEQFSLLSAKLDGVQSLLITVAADLQWVKEDLKNNRSTRRTCP